jgi:hypothetical protein
MGLNPQYLQFDRGRLILAMNESTVRSWASCGPTQCTGSLAGGFVSLFASDQRFAAFAVQVMPVALGRRPPPPRRRHSPPPPPPSLQRAVMARAACLIAEPVSARRLLRRWESGSEAPVHATDRAAEPVAGLGREPDGRLPGRRGQRALLGWGVAMLAPAPVPLRAPPGGVAGQRRCPGQAAGAAAVCAFDRRQSLRRIARVSSRRLAGLQAGRWTTTMARRRASSTGRQRAHWPTERAGTRTGAGPSCSSA